MALSKKRMVRQVTAVNMAFAATATMQFYQGGLVGIDSSTGKLVKATDASTFIPLGLAAEDVLVPSGGGDVLVDLLAEARCIWFKNDTGAGEVTSGDIGATVHVLDDETVSINSAYNSAAVAGQVLKVDAVKGVLVKVN